MRDKLRRFYVRWVKRPVVSRVGTRIDSYRISQRGGEMKHIDNPDLTRTLGVDYEQMKWAFPNGYGASVVRGPYTYGGDEGLYELAVTLEPGGELTYDTPITDDVRGWLTPTDADALLTAIAELPNREGK